MRSCGSGTTSPWRGTKRFSDAQASEHSACPVLDACLLGRRVPCGEAVGKPDPRGAESVVHVDAFPAGREAAFPRGLGRIIRMVIAILLVGGGRSASPLTQTRHPTTRTARRRRGWTLGEQARERED